MQNLNKADHWPISQDDCKLDDWSKWQLNATTPRQFWLISIPSDLDHLLVDIQLRCSYTLVSYTRRSFTFLAVVRSSAPWINAMRFSLLPFTFTVTTTLLLQGAQAAPHLHHLQSLGFRRGETLGRRHPSTVQDARHPQRRGAQTEASKNQSQDAIELPPPPSLSGSILLGDAAVLEPPPAPKSSPDPTAVAVLVGPPAAAAIPTPDPTPAVRAVLIAPPMFKKSNVCIRKTTATSTTTTTVTVQQAGPTTSTTATASESTSSTEVNSVKPIVATYYADWTGDQLTPEQVDFDRFDWVDFGETLYLSGVRGRSGAD